MAFTKLIKQFINPQDEINNKNLYGMRVAEDFSRIIKRERACSDRGESHFSIIDFNMKKSKLNDASTEELLKYLSQRLRITDAFGWINKNHIGVLLFNTGADDACRFANDIRDRLFPNVVSLDYIVYTYPKSRMDFSDGCGDDGSGRKNDDSFDDQKLETSDKQIIESELSSSPQSTEITISNNSKHVIGEISPLIVRRIPIWKRCIDIIGASTCLIIFAPLFLLIGLIIKIVSPGQVLFKQERVGYGGKRFNFIKFRTMKVNADTCTHQKYLSELINECGNAEESGRCMAKLDPIDSQIIPFGRLLRNTCLDELPQLINVLRGEMCLVGPRPPIPYEVNEYLRWHKSRFDIVPGISGLWQVSGKNRLTFKEMIRLDIRYAQSITFWEDLKILFKTPLAIIDHIRFSREQTKLAGKEIEKIV